MNKIAREDVIEIAVLAPSPHNTQPRRFKIKDETSLDIYYDPSRLLPIEDSVGRFMTTGMGMLIEAIDIICNENGYSTNLEYNGIYMHYQAISNPKPKYFCTIHRYWIGKKIDNSLTINDIVNRRTSRVPFDIAVDISKKIESLHTHQYSKDFERGHSTSPGFIDKVLDLNAETIITDLLVGNTRREIGSRLRYSKHHASKTHDGLRSACMNFPSWLMWIFFHVTIIFRYGPLKQYAKGRIKSSTQTSAVVWMISKLDTPTDWLKAGRDVMRFRLACSKAGLYMHPFGSVITNEHINLRLRELIDIGEVNPEYLWLVVRIGSSQTPTKSNRLPLSSVLLSGDFT